MNVVFTLPDIDSWTIEQIYENFGKPRTDTVSRLDDQPLDPAVPPYTVELVYFFRPTRMRLTKQIKIMDFGEASFSNEERVKSNTPMLLRPPEAFFNESIGMPADIWALACAIFDLFGKRSLFESFIPDKDSVLLEMIETLGMLPDRWWRRWKTRRRYLLDDGAWNPKTMILDEEFKPLALRIKRMRLTRKGCIDEGSEQLDGEALVGLHNLLTSLLRYEPSQRLTTKEVLKSNWVQQLLLEDIKSID